MNCPVCGENLREITRYNVQVDICPGCKGVWLDRGELEKIIEMASGERPVSGEPLPERPREERDRYYEGHDRHDHHDHDDHHDHHRYENDHHDHGWGGHGRRKSWLSDLFD